MSGGPRLYFCNQIERYRLLSGYSAALDRYDGIWFDDVVSLLHRRDAEDLEHGRIRSEPSVTYFFRSLAIAQCIHHHCTAFECDRFTIVPKRQICHRLREC